MQIRNTFGIRSLSESLLIVNVCTIRQINREKKQLDDVLSAYQTVIVMKIAAILSPAWQRHEQTVQKCLFLVDCKLWDLIKVNDHEICRHMIMCSDDRCASKRQSYPAGRPGKNNSSLVFLSSNKKTFNWKWLMPCHRYHHQNRSDGSMVTVTTIMKKRKWLGLMVSQENLQEWLCILLSFFHFVISWLKTISNTWKETKNNDFRFLQNYSWLNMSSIL